MESRMAGIKSELTNKEISGTPRMREFEVSDESGYTPPQSYQATSEPTLEEINNLLRSRNFPPLDQKTASAFNERQKTQRALSDDELINLEKQVNEARRNKISGKEKLSLPAKSRIEALLGARQTKDVSVDDQSYTLQTLKGKEQRQVILAATQFDATIEFPFELRKQVLGRALKSVNGIDLGLFLGNESLEAKLEFIEELDDIISNRLYDEYLGLVSETKQKYNIKNSAEVEEVSNDLKK